MTTALRPRKDLDDWLAEKLADLWVILHADASVRRIWELLVNDPLRDQLEADPEESIIRSYMNVKSCSVEQAVLELAAIGNFITESDLTGCLKEL